MSNPAAAEFKEGFRIEPQKSGLLITTTDYHARPLRISWEELGRIAATVGVSVSVTENPSKTSKP